MTRRPREAAVAVAAALALASCAREATPREASSASPRAGSVERGLATYYGDSLAGNRTASGERYDPRALTAAHRTLPFGTIVRVTRSDAPRAVDVRINDRGPFGDRRRIIDVSRRAAEDLAMLRAGVVPVRVEVLAVGEARRAHPHGPR